MGTDKMFISTTHGAWAQNTDGSYGLTFAGFAFDDAGRFLAVQRIRVSVQLNEAEDTFSGPFKTDFVDGDGQIVASSSGTVRGTRLQVETLA
jgi:hypothetical protein